MKGRLAGWSALGLCLATPFGLMVLVGYWTYMRCDLRPWLGPCADPKASAWLTFLLGLPWSGASGAGVLSEVVLLGSPLLNTVLVYNLGRMLQYAWSPLGRTPEWKGEPPNNEMQRTKRAQAKELRR